MTKIKNILILTSEIDSHNDQIDVKNLKIPKTLQVTKNFHNDTKIGICTLKKQNDKLYADFDIDMDEIKVLGLNPAIQLKINKEDVELCQSKGIWDVNKIKLISVGLCDNKNVDESIKSIGEQLHK